MQFSRAAIVSAIFALSGGVAALVATPAVHAAEEAKKAETIRPELAKPLQATQELLKAQKYQEALAALKPADDITDKTPFETYVVERLRLGAASGAGDTKATITALEGVLGSGHASPAEKTGFIPPLASSYYKQKDFGKAAEWAARYFTEGGTDPQMRVLLAQAYYSSNQFGDAAKTLQADIEAAEKTGAKPTEDQLGLLGNSYLKLNDAAGYTGVLRRLVTYYPNKDYWNDLALRAQKTPGFAASLSIDVLRLKAAAGAMEDADEVAELAQLALQAGFPGEAKKVIDKGVAAGVLKDDPKYKQLRDTVERQAAEDQKVLASGEMDAKAGAAKDGAALVDLGYAYVVNGQADKGLPMMEKGVQSVAADKADEAKLHLGEAYLMAGQKDKALSTFQANQGGRGAKELAELWAILAKQ